MMRLLRFACATAARPFFRLPSGELWMYTGRHSVRTVASAACRFILAAAALFALLAVVLAAAAVVGP